VINYIFERESSFPDRNSGRRYWYLYPIRDIARAYGMSECKTASLFFRMRKELKVHLEKEDITL